MRNVMKIGVLLPVAVLLEVAGIVLSWRVTRLEA